MTPTHVCKLEFDLLPLDAIQKIVNTFNSDAVQGWEPESLFCCGFVANQMYDLRWHADVQLVDARSVGKSPHCEELTSGEQIRVYDSVPFGDIVSAPITEIGSHRI